MVLRATGAATGIKSIEIVHLVDAGEDRARPRETLLENPDDCYSCNQSKVPYLVALVAPLGARVIVMEMALVALGQGSPIWLPFACPHVVGSGDILPFEGLLFDVPLKLLSGSPLCVKTRTRSLHVPAVISVAELSRFHPPFVEFAIELGDHLLGRFRGVMLFGLVSLTGVFGPLLVVASGPGCLALLCALAVIKNSACKLAHLSPHFSYDSESCLPSGSWRYDQFSRSGCLVKYDCI
ncbi:hypothetical protein Tco_0099693 [Tanacetum coccineum]